MRYKLRLQCETLTKQGKRPCRAPGILMKNGKVRCKVHGGYSTGPKTAEGKARSANNIIKYNEQRANNNRANNEQLNKLNWSPKCDLYNYIKENKNVQ